MAGFPKLRLPFSYEVLQYRTDGQKSVVLCRLPSNPDTPWATWRVDDKGNCFWGHYAHSIEQATEDFRTR